MTWLAEDVGSVPSGHLTRPALFVAVLGLAWVTVQPYVDLGDPNVLELSSGRDAITYVLFFLLAAACLTNCVLTQGHMLPALKTRASIALGAWLLFSVVTSQDIATSIKHMVLLILVGASASSLMLLADGRRQLAVLLAVAMGLLLFLSYAGLVLVPRYAIHQASDVMEFELAGDWRGVFAHKNAAGAIFAMGLFIGIYVARNGFRVAGTLIGALAVLFVVMAHAKTSTMIVVVTLGVSGFVACVRSIRLRVTAIFLPLVVLLVLGPGVVLSPAIAALVHALPVDATFTGRTDIWQLAFQKIAERPLMGYGFAAFWTLPSTRYGAEDDNWAGAAAHAHNGYIDMALNIGMPGLCLTLIVLMWQPLRDFLDAEQRRADAPLTMLLFQIWLFGIYLSVMESFFFTRVDPIWTTFLFAVFGLRYLAFQPQARA